MKSTFLKQNNLVLAVLILLTLLSWYLALSEHTIEQASNLGGVIMLSVAFIKVRMIMQSFMEVRHAPIQLRLTCDVWLVLAALALLASYLGWFPKELSSYGQ